jgi:Uma2 family endonuclease
VVDLETKVALPPEHLYTPGEYLAVERQSPYKSEYRAGEIVVVSGASRGHSIIVANLASELNMQLRARECEVYLCQMRVRTPDAALYAYPDVVVVCGEPQFEDECDDTLLNPNLIVEVLSPSTEAYDRARKFTNYRKIESLKEYVLIAQQECRVTQYIKQRDSEWLFREASAIGDSVHLPSIDCNLALARVYRRIQFPELC